MAKGATKASPQMTEQKWNAMGIDDRVIYAREKGLPGRIGGSSWNKLDEEHKTALKYGKAEKPKAEKQERVEKPAKVIRPKGKTAKQVEEVEEDEDEDVSVAPRSPAITPIDGDKKTRDFALWIGTGSYPTIASFIEEAKELGVSRRVGRLANGLSKGSRIFLIHDEGMKGDAVIFGYFVLDSIEMIVNKASDIPEDLRDMLTPILVKDARKEPERGCGWRSDPGAVYLTAYVTEDIIKRLSEVVEDQKASIQGSLVVFDRPRDYNKIVDSEATRFRGLKKVRGDRIISSKKKKSHPLKRFTTDLDLTKKEISKPGKPWSEKEITELIRLVEERSSQYQAFREYSLHTKRSISAITFQYDKINGKRDSKGGWIKAEEASDE